MLATAERLKLVSVTYKAKPSHELLSVAWPFGHMLSDDGNFIKPYTYRESQLDLVLFVGDLIGVDKPGAETAIFYKVAGTDHVIDGLVIELDDWPLLEALTHFDPFYASRRPSTIEISRVEKAKVLLPPNTTRGYFVTKITDKCLALFNQQYRHGF